MFRQNSSLRVMRSAYVDQRTTFPIRMLPESQRRRVRNSYRWIAEFAPRRIPLGGCLADFNQYPAHGDIMRHGDVRAASTPPQRPGTPLNFRGKYTLYKVIPYIAVGCRVSSSEDALAAVATGAVRRAELRIQRGWPIDNRNCAEQG